MTTNIVILGSCKHEPYKVTVPEKVPGKWNTEEGYEEACKVFYPAINEADIVLVWLPNGKIGEHTKRDLTYALTQNKRVILITPDKVLEF